MSKIKPSIKIEIDFDQLVAEYLEKHFPQYLSKYGSPNYVQVDPSELHEVSPDSIHPLLDSGEFRESCYVIGYNCNATIGNQLLREAGGKDMRVAFEFGAIVLTLEYSGEFKKKETDDDLTRG